MEEKKRLCGYYNYTVVLTYLGMLIGGITYTMEAAYRQAVLCLMTAGVCDMFDGTVAATKQRSVREKRFGIQIDSLSDLICFGVLPALFTYNISGKRYSGLLAGCLYLLCALIRLGPGGRKAAGRNRKTSVVSGTSCDLLCIDPAGFLCHGEWQGTGCRRNGHNNFDADGSCICASDKD